MAGGVFFLSWALWQQMTFVLAMGIVAVFIAGLVKLWWNNRLMKKQEILDEEKRARVEEMRRTGIPIKRASEIPFGVRALQGGVEVDGIWISRPLSSKETSSGKPDASVTVINLDDKGREYLTDKKSASLSTTNPEQAPTPKRGPSDGSIFQRIADNYSADGSQSAPPPVSQFASQPRRPIPRMPSVLNEDTLRRLEGQAQQQKPVYDTYLPTTIPRNPRQPSQRSSVSSSGESMGESMDSQQRSMRSASGRSYTSSHSSRLYMARTVHGERGGYHTVSHGWQGDDHRDPFGTPLGVTPARTPSGFSAFSQGTESHSSAPRDHDLLMPEPTFGPGDLHANRTTRRVNDGFEVLPAGTFSVLHEYKDNARTADLNGGENLGPAIGSARFQNRLKKSNGQLREEEQTQYGR